MEVGQHSTPRRHDDRWALVRKNPKLSGEAKLAWWYLFFQRAGGVPDTAVVVSPAEISADQGTGDRSGRRALQKLTEAGLIRVRTDGPTDTKGRTKGPKTVFMHDPLIVERARLVPALSDGQGALFPEELKSEPEEVGDSQGQILALRPGSVSTPRDVQAGPHPPPCPAPSAAVRAADVAAVCVPQPPQPNIDSLRARANKTLNINILREDVSQCLPSGGFGSQTAASSAAGKTSRAQAWAKEQLEADGKSRLAEIHVRQTGRHEEPGDGLTPLGDALAGRLERVVQDLTKAGAMDETTKRIDALTRWILDQVQDPNFHELTCRRIAWAVIEGLFPRAKLDGCLRSLRKKKDCRNRGGYFMNSIKNSFRECDLDWKGKPMKKLS